MNWLCKALKGRRRPFQIAANGTARYTWLATGLRSKQPSFLLRAAPFSAADASAVSNKVIDPSDNANTMVRVNKGISILCGISRREAEKYIIDKKVSVNGQLLTNLSSKLNLDEDIVMVNGKEVKFQKKAMMQSRIWLCHKLKGELVTTNDPESRLTIYDRFKSMNIPDARRLKYIGRLDRATSGLILFTNDGKLKRFMENPKLSYITRKYQVTIEGQVQHDWLNFLKRGAVIDGVKYRPMKIEFLRAGSDGSKFNELEMTLTEGKKNEIRKVLKAGGMPVKRLHRLEYGPYSLSGLNPGDIIEVKVNEKFLNSAKDARQLLRDEKKRKREKRHKQKRGFGHRGGGDNAVRFTL